MSAARRLILLLAIMAVATFVAASVVLAATITGTDRSDQLQGTAQNDTMYGKGADDRLEGLVGNDTIYGSDGHDELMGGNEGQATGSDSDHVLGELGDDYLAGGPGADRLYGGAGADMLQGGVDDAAQDTADGGDGDDVIDVQDCRAVQGRGPVRGGRGSCHRRPPGRRWRRLRDG